MPVPLRWIVERCLAKLPDERYASTRDLARDLQSVRDHFSQIEAAPRRRRSRSARPRPRAASGSRPASRSPFAALVASAYLLRLGARGPGAAVVPPADVSRRDDLDGALGAGRRRRSSTAPRGTARPIQIYSTRPEMPGVRGADAAARERARDLARGRDGDLARRAAGRAVLDRRHARARRRSPAAAPREILESVQAADWAADGASLVVLRTVDGPQPHRVPDRQDRRRRCPRATSPIARVSPRGDLVAFLEHPMRGDDGGRGRRRRPRRPQARALVRAGSRCAGSPGRPTAREVWFTAAAAGGSRALHAVSLAGQRRLVSARPRRADAPRHFAARAACSSREEHSREGIVGLLARSRRASATSPGTTGRGRSTSRPDGTTLLFDETGEGGGAGYAVYLRTTDDAPAVRLGDGHALALSPGRQVGALDAPDRRRPSSSCCPTGAGQPRRIRRATSPTSCGRRGRRAASTSSLARERARPRARGCTCSPSREARRGPSRRRASGPTGPSRPTATRSRRPTRTAACCSTTSPRTASPSPVRGRSSGRRPDPLHARRPRALRPGPRRRPARGDRSHRRVDRRAREPGREVAPPDPIGVFGVPRVFLSADGQSYVYTYVRLLDELYLVDGLR